MKLPQQSQARRRRPARRPAERKAAGAGRGQDRPGAPPAGRGPEGDRGHQLRLAQVGAADGRQRRGDGRHRAQARRALFGAHAQHEGLRGARVGEHGPTRSWCSAPPARPSASATSTARSPRASSASRRWSRRRAPRASTCAARSRSRVGCPYEGEIAPERVELVARLMKEIGVQHIGVADTIGVGTPVKVQRAMEAALKHYAIDDISGPLPRHLRPGAGQHAGQPGDGRLAVRHLGRPAWAAARTPRAPPATSRPRTWSTCCTAWASRPASTWTS